MQQIKLFKGIESELPRLEQQINTWLKDSGARVVQMFGNLAPQSLISDSPAGPSLSPYAASDMVVGILYEKD